MTDDIQEGILLDESCVLSIADLSRACSMHAEWVLDLIAEGILEPDIDESRQCQFSAPELARAFTTMRLQRDLDVNLAGVALVLDLMDEIHELRAQLVYQGSLCINPGEAD
jgi:chaperone modulatory protein CbpM